MFARGLVGFSFFFLSFFAMLTSPGTAGDRGIAVLARPHIALPINQPHYTSSHALVIGIDNYSNGWPRLRNAVKDAELIAAEMAQRGFEVTLRKNSTARELKEIFEQFYAGKGADPAARLFVWYAGHGHTIDGEGYLVPADAPLPSARPLGFKLRALNMRRFGDYVRLAQAKHSYTVFDSCFGGAVFSSTRGIAVTPRRQPAHHFLTAGTADQKVADDGGFRRLFLRALRGQEKADANNDQFLTTSELGGFMSARYGKMTDGRQTPRSGSLQSNPSSERGFVFSLTPPPPRQFVSIKPVDIWTSDQGSFERIIFDWPQNVAYAIDRQDDQTRIIFDAQAKLKIQPLAGQKLRNVIDARTDQNSGETILTLNIPADSYVHDFVAGNQIIVDVVDPPGTNIQMASYPTPRTQQVVTRSLPSAQPQILPQILSATLSILQQARPRPRPQRTRTFHRTPTRWRNHQRRHQRWRYLIK